MKQLVYIAFSGERFYRNIYVHSSHAGKAGIIC